MPTAFDIHEHRTFSGGWTVPNIGTHIYHFLGHHHFHVSVHATSATQIFVHARKHGLHANFIPVLRMTLVHNPTQGWVVSVHYAADIRMARAIGFGILTGGLSTLVGAGTLSAHVHDAECFVGSVWQSLAAVSSSGPGRHCAPNQVAAVAFPASMPAPTQYAGGQQAAAPRGPAPQPQGANPNGIYSNPSGPPPQQGPPGGAAAPPPAAAAPPQGGPPFPPGQNSGPACTGCGGLMQVGWKACPNCGQLVKPSQPAAAPPPQERKCKGCATRLEPGWKACPSCGTMA